ncbi:MAG: tetratricopeptide repeat protein [Terriglobales bacterium]
MIRISLYKTKPITLFLFALAAVLPLRAADLSTASLIEQGHYKRAQPLLAERLKANPNDAQTWCEMSKVSVAFERWDEAIQQAEKAVALDPTKKNAEFRAALADAVVSKLSASQAGMFTKLSLARRFRQEAEQALQLDPNNLDAASDLLEFHLEAPSIVGGDKQKALEIADRMVRANPVRGYLLQLEIATHDKKPAGQLESLVQQAIKADPMLYYARTQAAYFYISQGGPALTKAEEQARQAIRLDPSRGPGYVALATIYAQQARWKELDSTLADAQREVPDNLAPHYQAAKAILMDQQNPDLTRAEKYLRTYLSQPPEGNQPTLSAAHWRLGLVLEKQGHKDQAKQELQQAVSLDPDFDQAKKDLKRLQ